MTIMGAIVESPALATVWADTQIFAIDGLAMFHAPKLVVNPVARIVAAGTGWRGVSAAGRQIVLEANTLEEAICDLPDALRVALKTLRKYRGADNESPAPGSFLLAGYCVRLRRVRAVMFSGDEGFEPCPVTSMSSPHNPAVASYSPDQDDLHMIVLQQAADMARDHEWVPKGIVTLARVTSAGITTSRLMDLAKEPVWRTAAA